MKLTEFLNGCFNSPRFNFASGESNRNVVPMDPQLEALEAQRRTLAGEVAHFEATIREGKKGQISRIIALTYGTGDVSAFNAERDHRAVRLQLEQRTARLHDVEAKIVELRRHGVNLSP